MTLINNSNNNRYNKLNRQYNKLMEVYGKLDILILLDYIDKNGLNKYPMLSFIMNLKKKYEDKILFIFFIDLILTNNSIKLKIIFF